MKTKIIIGLIALAVVLVVAGASVKLLNSETPTPQAIVKDVPYESLSNAE